MDLSQTRIVIFDLAVTGHHSTYIRHLVEYWLENEKNNKLYCVVSPKFATCHSDVLRMTEDSTVRIQAVDEPEYEQYVAYKQNNQFLRRVLFEFSLVKKYSEKVNATHCVLMYFDHFQLPLALGLSPFCPTSGIYFRPTFHYSAQKSQILKSRERLRRFSQRFLLQRALQNKLFSKLFVLDPLSVSHIQKIASNTSVQKLADPVKFEAIDSMTIKTFRDELGIDSSRTVFLQFGTLNHRKGIHQLLEAIHLLSDEVSEKICLLLVGKADDSDCDKISLALSRLEETQKIQIIRQDTFVPEDRVSYYFGATDYILAPYQRHVGMSGIVMQAAAATKPILASNYGLVGELVKQYQLGETYDSSSPVAIAQAITRAVDTPSDHLINVDKAQAFAKENSSEAFAEAIFSAVCK